MAKVVDAWIIGIASVVAVLSAQTAETPKFEAVSIKPNQSANSGGSSGFRGNRFIATNVPLRGLIASAFAKDGRPLLSVQIVGGSDAVLADKFDIVATTGSTQTAQELYRQLPNMLRVLLKDRFMLNAHMERRQLPIYALVLAKTDGKLGPQLRNTVVDCLARTEAVRAGTPLSPAPTDRPPCGMRFGPGTFSAGGITLENLAGTLSGTVGTLVSDRTGLAGTFDIELQWTPEQTSSPSLNDPPSIFTAVQEQLGLRLESTKGPVDVLVIDRVEHPTED